MFNKLASRPLDDISNKHQPNSSSEYFSKPTYNTHYIAP